MELLIDKFPDGYEGWAKEKGETVAAGPKTTLPKLRAKTEEILKPASRSMTWAG